MAHNSRGTQFTMVGEVEKHVSKRRKMANHIAYALRTQKENRQWGQDINPPSPLPSDRSSSKASPPKGSTTSPHCVTN